MVAIRLTRTGAKKKPTYRVIVTDKRRPRDSKTLEIVGFYNPRPTPIELNLERERIDYWVGVGAQPSDTVKRLIKFFDAQGPTLSEPKKKAMQAAAEAAPPKARPEPVVEATPTAEEPAAEATTEEPKAEEAKTEEAPAEA
jgi:small subunit ribosomal protein S16